MVSEAKRRPNGTLLPFAELLLICVLYNPTSGIQCDFFFVVGFTIVHISSYLGCNNLDTNV